MKESVLEDKSYAFALKIVKLSQHLQSEKKEFVLSKQILRSGTAIGARTVVGLDVEPVKNRGRQKEDEVHSNWAIN